jgi:hypothetical protein
MVEIVVDPQLWESLEAAGQLLARALLVHEPVAVLAPHAGIVEDILVPAGERFGPGHVLARLVAF